MKGRHSLSRREFLQAAGLGAIGVLVASCAPKVVEVEKEATGIVEKEVTTVVEKPAKVSEQIEIRVSVWGDIPDKNINDRSAAAFAKVRGDIKVVPETYIGDYYDKVTVNFAGGTAPDLVYMEGFRWQPFTDMVVPLDDYIKRDDKAKAWADVQCYADLTTWRGKRYLSIIDTGSIVMFYNKTLFDKRGVPYPTDDWTFSDFKELLAKMTFEEDGVQYYGYAGGVGVSSYAYSICWLRMNGKMEFDRIVEPEIAQWNQPEIVEVIQVVGQDILKEGYAPSPATLKGGGVSIATNRVAMAVHGPWYLPQCYGPQAVSEEGIEYDVCMPPAGSAGSTPDAEIQGHMISKDGPHHEEAWEVMKFWMGEEVAKITAEEGRMCGTPEQTDKFWVPIATETYNFKNAGVFVQAQLHGRCPMCGGAGANVTSVSAAGSPLREATDAMRAFDKTAQEALDEANVKIQKQLDDYWAKQS